MADVFISYARSDRERVAPLVAAIEAQGWTVWWDPEIDPGQEFDRLIAAELKAAAAVLVVWTPDSVTSRWVRGEAREGADRGVLVVPDVICNAGGVTVSYFEWVQDFSSFFWSEDEINVRLDKIMVDALKRIWDTADRHKISLRTATFAVACERILTAREERGLYP